MIGKRLREVRKKRDLKQKELSEKSKVSAQNITRYENAETTNVKADTLANLAKALNTSTDYLLGLSDFLEVEPIEFNQEDTVQIPIYGTIPAGRPIEAIEVDEGYLNIAAKKLKGGKTFIGLKVKGDSMYPFYHNGDVVIIEITPEAQSGEDVIAFVGYDHEATLKKFHKKDDHIELEPINREYPIKKYYKNDVPVRILGVVRELRREIS